MSYSSRVRLVLAATGLIALLGAVSAAHAEMTPEQRVEKALVSPNTAWVRMQLGLIPLGTPRRDEVLAHLNQLKKQDAVNAKKQEEEDLAKSASVREAYGRKLREKFLDEGLDIKVKVDGKSSTQLNLQYTLFNDVWVHKFKKGTLVDEIGQMGFKHIQFSDGYHYHAGLTFN